MKRASILFLLAVVGCSASPADESEGSSAGAVVNAPASPAAPATRTVPASRDAKIAKLPNVIALTRVPTTNHTEVTLYELGGGDPTMNGDHLWLGVRSETARFIWNTGLDVRKVVSATSPSPGIVALTVVWDTQTPDGIEGSEQGTVTIDTLSAGKLTDGINMDAPDAHGGPSGVIADDSPAAQLLGNVVAVHKAVAGPSEVGVFEVSDGNRATNGDHLYVAVAQFPEAEVFDLGNDFATVTGLEKSGESEVTLRGTSETAASGDVRRVPFAAKLAFSVDAQNGKIAPSLKVTTQ